MLLPAAAVGAAQHAASRALRESLYRANISKASSGEPQPKLAGHFPYFAPPIVLPHRRTGCPHPELLTFWAAARPQASTTTSR